MKVAFVGRPKLGGVKMRGVAVARELGVPFIDSREIRASDRWDALVLVKYWDEHAATLRAACERLIFDPLDCWMQTKPYANPEAFWNWTWKQLRFDAIIGTSPACIETMEATPKRRFSVHLAPHHADPRVGPDWYDPNGPIVYAGGRQYIEAALPKLEKLPRMRFDFEKDAWKSLRGASLMLHVRLHPHDTPLNRHCKPQVKLENAAAAGLPILATDDPCVTSMLPTGYPVVRKIDDWFGNNPLPSPLCNPVTLADHCNRMREILGL